MLINTICFRKFLETNTLSLIPLSQWLLSFTAWCQYFVLLFVCVLIFETASLYVALALMYSVIIYTRLGLRGVCCTFGYRMPASSLQLIHVPLNHPGRGYRWDCFLEVLVKNIHFPTMDMILFRNKENLISTWLKVSQRIENQVPDFKHWCPLSYYLVMNIYYLVLQISKLKCCPLDCGILERKQYVLYFPSSLCSRSQCSLTVDLVWVPRSKWGQSREQFTRSIQVYYRITRWLKDGTFISTWVNVQKAIRFWVY